MLKAIKSQMKISVDDVDLANLLAAQVPADGEGSIYWA